MRNLVIVAGLGLAGSAFVLGQLCGAASRAGTFFSQPIGPAVGQDVIVGQIDDVTKWGGVGDIHAYSIGTTACNIGSAPLAWAANTNQHPVIAQNVYRIKNVNGASRIDQIGMSWLKHGFCATQDTVCAACTPVCFGCCDALGVGCSDPYSSTRNGYEPNLGPRYQINASTGAFPFPFQTLGVAGLVTYKRVQVNNNDLNPALNPGAVYYAEAQYIHPEDAASGNGNNNASHRKAAVGVFTGGGYMLPTTGPTIPQLPAIWEWQTFDPTVVTQNVDVPGDGRFVVAYDVTDLGAGTWHYEYAVFNLNSHRSGASFSVPIPAGVAISNIQFRDIDYHSQVGTVGTSEVSLPAAAIVDNVDWTSSLSAGALTWSVTTPYSATTDNTANALRWSTMYNFRFDANRPPVATGATLGLFRPGTPSGVAVAVKGPSAPPCPADLNASATVNGIDLALFLGAWTGATTYTPCPPPVPADLNGDCKINGLDLAVLLGAWGPCP